MYQKCWMARFSPCDLDASVSAQTCTTYWGENVSFTNNHSSWVQDYIDIATSCFEKTKPSYYSYGKPCSFNCTSIKTLQSPALHGCCTLVVGGIVFSNNILGIVGEGCLC